MRDERLPSLCTRRRKINLNLMVWFRKFDTDLAVKAVRMLDFRLLFLLHVLIFSLLLCPCILTTIREKTLCTLLVNLLKLNFNCWTCCCRSYDKCATIIPIQSNGLQSFIGAKKFKIMAIQVFILEHVCQLLITHFVLKKSDAVLHLNKTPGPFYQP